MDKPTIYRYGYNDGKRGLEATYCVNDGTLYIKIDGSNHWADYIGNLAAWPRCKGPLGKVHMYWASMAIGLAADIVENISLEERKRVHIAGHSMGGSVGSILPAFIEWEKITIWTVNAPKPGNRKFSDWLSENTDFVAWFDAGDIVRRFPLFYAGYPNPRCYEMSQPFWKAHNRMPEWWNSFPDRVVTK